MQLEWLGESDLSANTWSIPRDTDGRTRAASRPGEGNTQVVQRDPEEQGREYFIMGV